MYHMTKGYMYVSIGVIIGYEWIFYGGFQNFEKQSFSPKLLLQGTVFRGSQTVCDVVVQASFVC